MQVRTLGSRISYEIYTFVAIRSYVLQGIPHSNTMTESGGIGNIKGVENGELVTFALSRERV